MTRQEKLEFERISEDERTMLDTITDAIQLFQHDTKCIVKGIEIIVSPTNPTVFVDVFVPESDES